MSEAGSVIEQLAEFLKTSQDRDRLWLRDERMSVYVRKSIRYLPEEPRKLRTCLDIANVGVEEMGQGAFTEFHVAAHEMNPWHATYVENSSYPEVTASLVRHGYLILPDAGFNSHSISSLYKLTESGHESVRHARASEYEAR